MNYEGQFEETPDYMSLAKMRFKLSLSKYRKDEGLKKHFLDVITRNHMARYYEDSFRLLGWAIDKDLLQAMSQANAAAWYELEIATANSSLEHSNWRQKLEFAFSTGDLERAKNIAWSIYENEKQPTSSRVEAAFGIFRISFLHSSVLEMRNIVRSIRKLLNNDCASGSEWCCRNKFKVYESVYCLAVRNFRRAARLLLDCIPTFESRELMTFKDLVEYAVIACAISLHRSELNERLNRNGVLQQALLGDSPRYKAYLTTFYDCQYADFFRHLAWIESVIKEDPLLKPHYSYYVREMRLKSYSQILSAYRSLSLNKMAEEFGVTEDYVEHQVGRFIASGRLQSKIDRVAGCVVTVDTSDNTLKCAPMANCNRSVLYQRVVKKGDLLLNNLQKLGQVVDF